VRNALAAAASLSLIAACSSSSDFSAASGGAGTTGGAQLAAGAPCTANGDCLSGTCGVDGTGNCCRTQCATGDAICGATSCDDRGVCRYPQPTVICASSCSADTLSQSNCNGQGTCDSQSPTACPGNFACGAEGGCLSGCSSSKQCAVNYVCNAGACVPAVGLGSCTEDDDCHSGVCGRSGDGGGNCCAARCGSTSPACAATACAKSDGSCVYPDRTVACGEAQSCTGETQQNAAVCDGKGNCPPAGATACSPYTCGIDACLNSCTDDSACGSGGFCDAPQATCCGGLARFGTITVDTAAGSDSSPCCGIGGHQPCQTLTRAMGLVDAAHAKNVTILADVNGSAPLPDAGLSGADWGSLETYPIALGWGVEVKAPGIYFVDTTNGPNVHSAIFEVRPFSAADTLGSASIAGTATNPVRIGMSAGGLQSIDPVSIQVETGGTLYLANAVVNGSAHNQSTAIFVNGGGKLIVGQDESQLVGGPVLVGNSGNQQANDGYDGIVCGVVGDAGCHISDSPLASNALTIIGEEDIDLDAEDFAIVSLSSSPVVGVAPSKTGFQTCPTKTDASSSHRSAVLLHGTANLSFDNGNVQCIAGPGFTLTASANGVPTLNLNKSTVQNTELGIHVQAGTATVSKSTIQFNYNGVKQDSDGTHDGTIDLSGGGAGGHNSVICANSGESVFGLQSGPPAISVLNVTGDELNASGVLWDTSGPDRFTCNPAITSCSCQSASCSVTPGSDGMDAVDTSTGSVNTADAGTSAVQCNTAQKCGSGACQVNQVCCLPIIGFQCCSTSFFGCEEFECF